MNKKLLTVVGILVVAAVLLAAFYFMKREKSKIASKPLEVSTKTLDSTAVPSGFPENLPVEAGSSVLQNYESTSNDGRKQSTRVATTTKSLDQAVKLYSDYFVKLGWSLIPSSQDSQIPNVVTALLKNKDNTLIITGRTDATSKQSSVSLTLTEIGTQKPQSNAQN